MVCLMFVYDSFVDKPLAVNASGINFQVLDLVETSTGSPEQDVTMPRRLADSVRVLHPAACIFTRGNRDIEVDTGDGAALGCDNRATPYLIDKTLRKLGDGDSKNLLFE